MSMLQLQAQIVKDTSSIKAGQALPDTSSMIPDSQLSFELDSLQAAVGLDTVRPDTIIRQTEPILPDSVLVLRDSLLPDSLRPGIRPAVQSLDLSRLKKAEGALDAPVNYKADTIRYDVKAEVIYLYGNAEVIYQTTTLTGGYIVFNKAENVVTAMDRADSSFVIPQLPTFQDGEQTFQCPQNGIQL